MIKENIMIEHRDIFGELINVDDFIIVGTGSRNISLGKVVRLTPKMLSIKTYSKHTKTFGRAKLVYPSDAAIIDRMKVVEWLLYN